MMRIILNAIPYATLGIVLSSLGANMFMWQFWVAVISMMAAQLLAEFLSKDR